MTHCQQDSFLFQDLGARIVVADFSSGTLSSDGGVTLRRQLDAGLGLTRARAGCFRDGRNQLFVDHSMPQLLAQRIYGLALGNEDLNDHAQLRRDPLLATACAKSDPLGQERFNPQDRGIALAGPSTLNRLELSNNKNTRCHILPHDPAKIAACLLEMGGRCLPKHAKEIVLDLDSMGLLSKNPRARPAGSAERGPPARKSGISPLATPCRRALGEKSANRPDFPCRPSEKSKNQSGCEISGLGACRTYSN